MLVHEPSYLEVLFAHVAGEPNLIIFNVDHDVSLEIEAAVQEDGLEVVREKELLELPKRVVIILTEEK